MHANCAPIDKKKIIVAAIAIFAALFLIVAAIVLTTCGKSDDSAKSEDAKQVSATTEQPASDKSDAQSSGELAVAGWPESIWWIRLRGSRHRIRWRRGRWVG